jgi:hypothetical protein
MITYSTNWMGPISPDWYRERGLTRKVTKVVEEDNLLVRLGRHKAGEVLEYEEITTHYAGGRIDIRGLDPDKFYNGCAEYSLPIMHGEDWNKFSDWLDGLETYHLWEYNKIIYIYKEETKSVIRWAN